MKKRETRITDEDGCQFCKGPGDCFGQCQERWGTMISEMLEPIKRLHKEIGEVLRRNKSRKPGRVR